MQLYLQISNYLLINKQINGTCFTILEWLLASFFIVIMCHFNFIPSYASRKSGQYGSVCLCVHVCGTQLKDLGDDRMQGFIPLPPPPKEREQKAGQKLLWPRTPALIPTPPCCVRAAVWPADPGDVVPAPSPAALEEDHLLATTRGHQGFRVPWGQSTWGKLPGM